MNRIVEMVFLLFLVSGVIIVNGIINDADEKSAQEYNLGGIG